MVCLTNLIQKLNTKHFLERYGLYPWKRRCRVSHERPRRQTKNDCEGTIATGSRKKDLTYYTRKNNRQLLLCNVLEKEFNMSHLKARNRSRLYGSRIYNVKMVKLETKMSWNLQYIELWWCRAAMIYEHRQECLEGTKVSSLTHKPLRNVPWHTLWHRKSTLISNKVAYP